MLLISEPDFLGLQTHTLFKHGLNRKKEVNATSEITWESRQVRSDHLGDHRQRKHRVQMYTADPKSRKAVAGVAMLHPPLLTSFSSDPDLIAVILWTGWGTLDSEKMSLYRGNQNKLNVSQVALYPIPEFFTASLCSKSFNPSEGSATSSQQAANKSNTTSTFIFILQFKRLV